MPTCFRFIHNRFRRGFIKDWKHLQAGLEGHRVPSYMDVQDDPATNPYACFQKLACYLGVCLYFRYPYCYSGALRKSPPCLGHCCSIIVEYFVLHYKNDSRVATDATS